ncbi:branched-chain amino acid aminotransferase [Lipingzhangella halophila]|uniref:Branched-chain amino acid aminotransferase n=1 Tax=Lipingzhangella halophila TaxID=1783352 RepID=A0A7W7REV0_9ACTN|nr:aminotransferase class IV [Lipingzhangella halophila]MBB4930712.1 branched-chain amino acid aminotransferase [Lipingzhangella halophila]
MRVWIAGAGYGDGQVVEAEDARISVLDHGITVGDGVFEAVKAVGGETFALTRHLHRLARSARALGLADPDFELIRHGVRQALDANPETGPARVRITVTAGPGPLGSERDAGEQTYVVAVGPLPAVDPRVDVAVMPWTRNENGGLTGVKSTSYAENVRSLAYAAERGAGEAIFANTSGNLCEGTGSNIFVVLDGRLVTPPLSAGPLAGITRELVLEWAGGEESDVPMARLAEVSEAFLASTGRDVQPIRAIDGRVLPESPGPVTRKASEVLTQRSAADLDP